MGEHQYLSNQKVPDASLWELASVSNLQRGNRNLESQQQVNYQDIQVWKESCWAAPKMDFNREQTD